LSVIKRDDVYITTLRLTYYTNDTTDLSNRLAPIPQMASRK